MTSLLQDATAATPVAVQRIEAWSRALRTAVERLHSEEFSSLSDVVKPFTAGLLQVHTHTENAAHYCKVFCFGVGVCIHKPPREIMKAKWVFLYDILYNTVIFSVG